MDAFKKISKLLLVWLVIVIPLKLIGRIVLGIVLFFVKEDKNELPRAVRWFDNAEIHTGRHLQEGKPRPDGLMGDQPYLDRTFGGTPTGYWPVYKARYDWLARRNAVNYFQVVTLGHKYEGPYTLVSTSGDVNVGDTRLAGLYTVVLRQKASGKEIWEWYLVKPLPFLRRFGHDRALRIRLGTKIYDPDLIEEGTWLQWTCSFGMAGWKYKD